MRREASAPPARRHAPLLPAGPCVGGGGGGDLTGCMGPPACGGGCRRKGMDTPPPPRGASDRPPPPRGDPGAAAPNPPRLAHGIRRSESHDGPNTSDHPSFTFCAEGSATPTPLLLFSACARFAEFACQKLLLRCACVRSYRCAYFSFYCYACGTRVDCDEKMTKRLLKFTSFNNTFII
jgi:hypothetical protein